jgi:hypothetical protein
MNRWFTEFIRDAKQRADASGVHWELRLGADGKVAREQRWDLSEIVRSPPPRALLSDLGTYEGCLEPLNLRRADAGLPPVARGPLGRGWRGLIQAAVLDQLLVRGNAPHGLASNIITPLRILGTCAGGVQGYEPILAEIVPLRAVPSRQESVPADRPAVPSARRRH